MSEPIRKIKRGHWRKKTLLSFAVFVTAYAVAFAGWDWLNSRPEVDGTPSPLRSGFMFNERLARKLYSPKRLDVPKRAPATGTEPRFNGDLGLQSAIDFRTWKLRLDSPAMSKSMEMSFDDLAKLPLSATQTEFRCIEGWSEFLSYGGIKFSDFMARTGVGTKSGKPYSSATPREDLYNYVGLETPDGEYYVSIDIESMLHPQTFLATTENGLPLSPAHGAPLRLIIPVKYGIKSLKRIGRIFFSDERPPDYWAEQGYDWYSGL